MEKKTINNLQELFNKLVNMFQLVVIVETSKLFLSKRLNTIMFCRFNCGREFWVQASVDHTSYRHKMYHHHPLWHALKLVKCSDNKCHNALAIVQCFNWYNLN